MTLLLIAISRTRRGDEMGGAWIRKRGDRELKAGYERGYEKFVRSRKEAKSS